MMPEENNTREYLGLFEEIECKRKLKQHKRTGCKKIKKRILGEETHTKKTQIHSEGKNGGWKEQWFQVL